MLFWFQNHIRQTGRKVYMILFLIRFGIKTIDAVLWIFPHKDEDLL